MASSAVSHVLGTPELLDHIFSFVDEKTLLITCQRVSKGFQDAIAASPTIRKRLFFRVNENATHCNVAQGQVNEAGIGYCKPEVNDFVLERTRRKLSAPFFSSAESCSYAHIGRSNKHATKVGAASSWRRMHLTNPPARRVAAWVSRDEALEGLSWFEPFKVKVENFLDLTLGNIVDGLQLLGSLRALDFYTQPAIHIAFDDIKDCKGCHPVYRIRKYVHKSIVTALCTPPPSTPNKSTIEHELGR